MTDTVINWPTHEGSSDICNHVAPYCPGCKKQAPEIASVQQFATEFGMSPEEFVRVEEGTYNPGNEHFLCDDCFIRIEIAAGRRLAGPNDTRWVCP